MKTQQLIAEAMSLPVEERTILVDSLLQSLNAPGADTERQWLAEAERRLRQVRSGQVRLIPGDEVFGSIKRRFSR
jgi:putative addiction module component (TIGR02574 family)